MRGVRRGLELRLKDLTNIQMDTQARKVFQAFKYGKLNSFIIWRFQRAEKTLISAKRHIHTTFSNFPRRCRFTLIDQVTKLFPNSNVNGHSGERCHLNSFVSAK